MKQIQTIIQEAQALIITAGAGMGVDSGLPDFRGVEGFWEAYPIIKKHNLRFEEMANPRWFKEDPHLAWAFYGHRLQLYRDTIPHTGFDILLKLAKQKKEYFIFTSNVDGQFQKAGFDPNRIVEVHGSIHHLQCTNNCTDKIHTATHTTIMIDTQIFRANDPLPACPDCGNIARPNILMFGDYAWNANRTDIQSNRLQHFLDAIMIEKKKTVILEFGAGKAVPTVRVFGEQLSKLPDITLIRVNPRENDAPEGAISLALGAKEMLETL